MLHVFFLLLLMQFGTVAIAGPLVVSRLSRLHALNRATIHKATYSKNETSIPSRACGTGEPSVHLLAAHRHLRGRRLRKRASPSTSLYNVDTYFHIVSTKDQTNAVTKAMIANQVGTLQAAYATSNISFDLIGVDRTVNDTWATDQNDADMKLALRKGNYSTLNIYFQTNLSTTAYGAPTQLLGYCTLPTNVTYSPCDGCPLKEFPTANYAMDGCNVHAGSMPNGLLDYYNQGKTAVHEVGHWFGLLHTFQDGTCDSTDAGDYIDDTPQESVSTDGCPAGKDSCPSDTGFDPIHNYMDYSTDSWYVLIDYLFSYSFTFFSSYEGFTSQQIIRMQDLFETLRFGQ